MIGDGSLVANIQHYNYKPNKDSKACGEKQVKEININRMVEAFMIHVHYLDGIGSI